MDSSNHISAPREHSNLAETKDKLSHSTVEMNTVIATVTEPDNNENDNGRLPDIVVEANIWNDAQTEETYFSIAIQVFIPFLVAGFGMVFAGLVLDRIQV